MTNQEPTLIKGIKAMSDFAEKTARVLLLGKGYGRMGVNICEAVRHDLRNTFQHMDPYPDLTNKYADSERNIVPNARTSVQETIAIKPEDLERHVTEYVQGILEAVLVGASEHSDYIECHEGFTGRFHERLQKSVNLDSCAAQFSDITRELIGSSFYKMRDVKYDLIRKKNGNCDVGLEREFIIRREWKPEALDAIRKIAQRIDGQIAENSAGNQPTEADAVGSMASRVQQRSGGRSV